MTMTMTMTMTVTVTVTINDYAVMIQILMATLTEKDFVSSLRI